MERWPGTVSSIRPLDASGIRWLVERLKSLDRRDVGRGIVELLLWSGAHPVVLSAPSRWGLSLGSDGLLTWKRAKTKEFIAVPVPPGSGSWMPDLIRLLERQRWSPVRINQLVHDTGSAVGMPELCPRTLRHTHGYLTWLETHDIARVQEELGCSPSVALGYIKLDTQGWKKGVIETGWSALGPV